MKRGIFVGIAAALFAVACAMTPGSHQTVAAASGPEAQLPASVEKRHADSVTLWHVARKSPCAAAALLNLLQTGVASRGGVLYLDGCPNQDDMVSVLNEFERGSTTAGISGLQWNPYSGSPLVVEVHWYAALLAGGTTVLKSRALAVRWDGVELEKPHLVEEMALVLMSDGQLRLPDAARSSPTGSL